MTRFLLFDDPRSERLRPFTWLRPASALLLGPRRSRLGGDAWPETTRSRWRAGPAGPGFPRPGSSSQSLPGLSWTRRAASGIELQNLDLGSRDPG